MNCSCQHDHPAHQSPASYTVVRGQGSLLSNTLHVGTTRSYSCMCYTLTTVTGDKCQSNTLHVGTTRSYSCMCYTLTTVTGGVLLKQGKSVNQTHSMWGQRDPTPVCYNSPLSRGTSVTQTGTGSLNQRQKGLVRGLGLGLGPMQNNSQYPIWIPSNLM